MPEIFETKLLNELLEFGVEVSFERKVLRVHRKCIRSGRMELAEKIFQKYSKHFEIKSDAAMAFYMSVIASKAK